MSRMSTKEDNEHALTLDSTILTTMTDLMSQSDAYFASLNPLTKKIIKEVENFKKTYGEEWTEFSPEKQEELLDKFLIDPRVAEKFSEAAADRPVVFPNYKVESGEKIVVDFDNEDVSFFFHFNFKENVSKETSYQTKTTYKPYPR